MFVVVCYDIPNNRRRAKIANILEGFGARVQKSVFECDVTDRQLKKAKDLLQKKIKPAEDRVRFYLLCEADVRRIEVVGKGKVHRARDLYIV